MENPTVLSEVSARLKMKAGLTYIVIPAVKRAGETGEFFLSMYFDIALHNMDIRNLSDQKNRCKSNLIKS